MNILSYFWIFMKIRKRRALLTLIIAIMRQDSFRPRMSKRRTPPNKPPKKPPKRSAP
jgi:hypothetical protein